MMMISDQNTTDATPNAVELVDRELRMVERFAERVDRAGPDVAVDDAEGAERQRGQPAGSHAVRPWSPDPHATARGVFSG